MGKKVAKYGGGLPDTPWGRVAFVALKRVRQGFYGVAVACFAGAVAGIAKLPSVFLLALIVAAMGFGFTGVLLEVVEKMLEPYNE